MTEETEQNSLVIFYHQDCLDGAASLAVASKYYSEQGYDIKAASIHHSSEEAISQTMIDSVTSSTEVLFLDVVAPTHLIEELLSQAKSVTIIDHHPATKEVEKSLTASYQEDSTNLTIIYNDEGHSGVTLTLEHLQPDKEPEWYLKDIRDVDLGAVENAKSTSEDIVALSAVLDNLPRQNLADITKSFEWLDSINREEAIKVGKSFLRETKNDMENALKHVEFIDVTLEGKTLNLPILKIEEGMFDLESESSGYPRALWPSLAQENQSAPLIMIALDRNDDGGRSISLRPNPNVTDQPELDLDSIAKHIHAELGGDGLKAGGRNGATAMHFSADEWKNIQASMSKSPAPLGRNFSIENSVELLQSKFHDK